MTLDALLEKSTVKFSRPIIYEEVEELFKYIAEKLPGEVRYTLEIGKKIPREKGDNEISSVKITGNINSLKYFSLAYFNCEGDYNSLSAIRFSTIPGYSLDEHSKEEVKLWEDVGKIVNDYFLEKMKEEYW